MQLIDEEQDSAGYLLAEMRRVTNEYVALPDACASYQALHQALQVFEADLHQYLHPENNLLFPRAVEMEDEALPLWGSEDRHSEEIGIFGH